MGRRAHALLIVAALLILSPAARAADEPSTPSRPPATRPAASESDYYKLVDIVLGRSGTDSRAAQWKPGGPLAKAPILEVSGLEVLPGKRVAVANRMGEVWLIDGAYADRPTDLQYTRFASALHEPLGLLRKGDGLYAMQRAELTRLRDADGDGVADEYLTAGKGWNVSGNYHEYAFGPKRDGAGNLWVTLNVGIGPDARNDRGWRGWAMTVSPAGELKPVCAGLRSPCALGANADGDMFMADQQGNWVPANALHHLRPGVFLGNADALKTLDAPGSPVKLSAPLPKDVPYPQALAALPELKPPAVWLPYLKMGQSSTDIAADDTGGKFGPFGRQLFVGDFTMALVSRVYLEKVDGEYQGACFPFRQGFASAVARLRFGEDGSLLAGLTNRGWSSRGTASYGLQRLAWTGHTPFEILQMKARPDGFELVFTKPVEPKAAADPASYAGSSYTYLYTDKYGSAEIDPAPLKVTSAAVAPDGRGVRLVVDGLRRYHVHELHAPGVRSADDEGLLHPVGYYTLNNLPK